MLVFRAISGKELNIKNYKQILEEANKESLYEILKEYVYIKVNRYKFKIYLK